MFITSPLNDDIFDFIALRIAKLRGEKGISARDMSLSLGQNPSYISKIENKKAKPSIDGLQYICEFFGLTLRDFINEEMKHPILIAELLNASYGLDEDSLRHLIGLAKQISSKK